MSLTRFCLVVLILSLVSGAACFAQDDAMQAAQQANDAAMQAAQQANDFAMQAAQQASQAAMQASQQANIDMMQAQLNAAQATQNECCGQTSKPKFTLKSGKYPSGQTVRIEDKTPHAIIFYTTDGWTPTQHSARYSGPISMTSTTVLQAIAVAPSMPQSPIAVGMYTINGAPLQPCGTPIQRPSKDPSAALRIPVALAFTSEIDTAKAEVGDSVPLTLARDVEVNGALLVPKGTPAVATVTQVTHAGRNASPGTISFRVQSLDVNGKTIRLHGGDTKEASPKNRTAFFALMLVPVAGPFIGASSLLVKGNNAVIEPGTCVNAMMEPNAPTAQVN